MAHDNKSKKKKQVEDKKKSEAAKKKVKNQNTDLFDGDQMLKDAQELSERELKGLYNHD